MSYNELRQFSSLMTQIGFPRPISIDTFRNPNFTLAAEILFYIASTIAPNDGLSMDIATQEDRVYFVTTAVNLLQSKLHIKLNIKKVYAAGTEAVRELRKAAQEVSAYLGATGITTDRDSSAGNYLDLTMHSSSLRQVSSRIVEASTKLLSQLRLYTDDISEAIQRAISSQPDATSLSIAVQQRIKSLAAEHSTYQEELATNKREKAKLEEQVAQIKQSITHTMDRLDAVRSTKPPFLAELEALEADLSKLHIEYARKFRSLLFLESQLRVNDVREQQRMVEREHNLKALQENALKEELDNMYKGVDAHSSSGSMDDGLIDTPMPQVMDLHAPPPQDFAPPPRAAPINTHAEIPDDETYSYSYEDEDEGEGEDDGISAGQAAPTGGSLRQPQHGVDIRGSRAAGKSGQDENAEDDDGDYSYEYSDIGGEELDPDNLNFS